MASNKKPRKPYRPRDPAAPTGFELLQPARRHGGYLTTLQLRNSSSLLALTQGRATAGDVNTLIAMYNIVQALRELGLGAEHDAQQGLLALVGVAHRAKTLGRFTPTGPEIQALNALMALHDAQMEAITVLDMSRAIAHAKSQGRRKSPAYLRSVHQL